MSIKKIVDSLSPNEVEIHSDLIEECKDREAQQKNYCKPKDFNQLAGALGFLNSPEVAKLSLEWEKTVKSVRELTKKTLQDEERLSIGREQLH